MLTSTDYSVMTIFALVTVAIAAVLALKLNFEALALKTNSYSARDLVDYASKVCEGNGGAETVTLKIKAPIASSIVCADGTEFGIKNEK